MNLPTLTWDQPETDLVLGDMILCYRLAKTGIVSFSLIPATCVDKKLPKRHVLQDPAITNLPNSWQPMVANEPESLVQLHLRGFSPPAAFAQGRTLRNGEACFHTRFQQQTINQSDVGVIVTTTLKGELFGLDHVVTFQTGDLGLQIKTVFRNLSNRPLTLEMLSSFSLSGITPFATDDAPGRLFAHRLRSVWSAEGRLDSNPLEALHLERSWSGHAHFSERFGQIGSMPVRGFFPFVALEDIETGVCWGAQLALASSWQLEIYRKHDDVCLSGGIADREFGHWWKTIPAGESFTSPTAVISTVHGDVDDLCHRLTSLQAHSADLAPAIEHTLPMVFNDWCSSWGTPTQDSILALARRLAGGPTRYLVIDAGWASPPGSDLLWQQNGDWIVNPVAFPNGLRPVSDAIRHLGLIPGIWFEFEVCCEGSQAWLQIHHLLHRDGEVLRVGTRRFWDFRDQFTKDHLTKKVINLLRENGFGYLKVDYNETIGFGVDGNESPGEGLRQHIEGVQEFFREMRRQLPDLVIENCSSGGHRLEPSMMAICSMGSFSDAHETPEIPLIAANLHRAILPRQSQIWAVLRSADSPQRLSYSLAATFLGRMALSGDLTQLSSVQMAILSQAQSLYQVVSGIIYQGTSRLFGERGLSYRHPSGWQAVRRISEDGLRILCVIHSFDNPPPHSLTIPLPPGTWRLVQAFNPAGNIQITAESLIVPSLAAFCGVVLFLGKA